MTSSKLIVIMIAATSLVVVACASAEKKGFAKIYPGMTADQVAKTMEKGPGRVEEFEDGYASWYYGEDRCLLMKKGEVVSKQQSKKKSSIDVFGIGGYDSKSIAQCVPLGHEKKEEVKRRVETPFGEVER